ncbi:MAG: CpsB/CapC family capsule biosynthesis tyrosine phosphatase, partial [Myxococcaceae bacterium]
AAALFDLGAYLKLYLAAHTGRSGPAAKRLSRRFLEEGLYAVAATDMHAPFGARDWVGKAIAELKARVGQQAADLLLGANPRAFLAGQAPS